MNLYRASYFQTKKERTIVNVKKKSYIFSVGFPHSSVVKESAYDAGDPGWIPGSGRSAGEGIGYPLQYSGLENSVDCIVYRVAKSRT